MSTNRKNSLANNIFILVFRIVLLQLVVSVLAAILGPLENVSILEIEFAISFILAMILIYLNAKRQRAFMAHVIFSMMFGFAVLPVLQLGIVHISRQNTNSPLFGAILIISFLAEWIMAFYFYKNEYDSAGKENQESGRINIKNGHWNLNKPLITRSKSDNRNWQNMAKLLAPFVAALSASLYRSLQPDIVTFLVALAIAFGITLASGLHAAIAIELVEAEKTLNKNIILYWL